VEAGVVESGGVKGEKGKGIYLFQGRIENRE